MSATGLWPEGSNRLADGHQAGDAQRPRGTEGSASDRDDERWARVLLAASAEPADESVGARLRTHGATTVTSELLTGTSRLPRAEGYGERLRSVDTDLLRRRAGVPAVGSAGGGGGPYPDLQVLIPGDPQWPTQLDDLGDRAPYALFTRGAAALRLLLLSSVSVVGSRACTVYGTHVTHDISAGLAADGCTVVSGGAYGIDAAAHRAALAAGGVTVAVLAGGVDVAYPRAHEGLFAQIVDDGLLVSEAPPHTPALRHRFLARNRLIAALTRGTVVIEAALRSGALSTAGHAAQLNRPVAAVPGPVTSAMSAGVHALIRRGSAVLVTDAREVLDLVGPLRPGDPEARGRSRPTDALTDEQVQVLDALPARRPVSVEQVAARAAVAVDRVLACLGLLELHGLVVRDCGAWRLAR